MPTAGRPSSSSHERSGWLDPASISGSAAWRPPVLSRYARAEPLPIRPGPGEQRVARRQSDSVRRTVAGRPTDNRSVHCAKREAEFDAGSDADGLPSAHHRAHSVGGANDVDEGLLQFVSCRYGQDDRWGGMLGYVVSGSTDAWLVRVNERIETHAELGIGHRLTEVNDVPATSATYRSEHSRLRCRDIALRHLWFELAKDLRDNPSTTMIRDRQVRAPVNRSRGAANHSTSRNDGSANPSQPGDQTGLPYGQELVRAELGTRGCRCRASG